MVGYFEFTIIFHQPNYSNLQGQFLLTLALVISSTCRLDSLMSKSFLDASSHNFLKSINQSFQPFIYNILIVKALSTLWFFLAHSHLSFETSPLSYIFLFQCFFLLLLLTLTHLCLSLCKDLNEKDPILWLRYFFPLTYMTQGYNCLSSISPMCQYICTIKSALEIYW